VRTAARNSNRRKNCLNTKLMLNTEDPGIVGSSSVVESNQGIGAWPRIKMCINNCALLTVEDANKN
jgi:hypothetical protein